MFRFKPKFNVTVIVTLLVCGVGLTGIYSLIVTFYGNIEQTRRLTTDLTFTVEQEVGRNIRLADFPLQAILKSLHALQNFDIALDRQPADIFDRTLYSEEFGDLLVLNENGLVMTASNRQSLPDVSFADQAFFLQHEHSPSLELAIGPAIVGRSGAQPAVSVSRRISNAHGEFGGVVVDTVPLSLFSHVFSRLDLGKHGSITLVKDDGTILLRYPQMPLRFQLADSTRLAYQAAARQESGFGEASGPDGVHRFYAFRRVANLPLFVVVGLSVQEVLTPWLLKVIVLGLLTLVLSGAAIYLTRELGRELQRRRDAEEGLRQFNRELEARILREVESREQAQSRLAAGQRMEALGQLAGGVAHDLNNVLQAVSSATRLLEQHAWQADEHRRLTGLISDAADRGASIVRRLLAFARQSDLQTEPTEATAIVLGLTEILTHTLGRAIEIHVDIENGLPKVLVDRLQLETVLVNLATNGRDAMGVAGGLLTIAVRACKAGDDVLSPAGLKPGGYLRFSVCDTGPGMTAAVLSRATEPFFTTKPPGRGTGLGLAMAKGFAEQSGGAFSIVSHVGEGTTVALWLPQADANEPQPTSKPVEAARGVTRPACILLVDDDAAVRTLLAEELEKLDYEVRQANDGLMGRDLLDTLPDVLVTDLSMPGLDGLSLIKEARRRRPRLPVILITGYAGDGASLALSGALSGQYSLLQKPVRASQLSDRVAAALQLSD